jgi:acetaldehyde dehydrogenase
MRNTVYCAIAGDADRDAISASVADVAHEVAGYVPGYRVKGVAFDEGPFDTPGGTTEARVSIFLEVTGNGDYLPAYAGNLDIMTAAAVRVGETLARSRLGVAA